MSASESNAEIDENGNAGRLDAGASWRVRDGVRRFILALFRKVTIVTTATRFRGRPGNHQPVLRSLPNVSC